jgi:signal transduction histidine kinase
MSFVYLAATIFVAFYGGFGPALIMGLVSSLVVDYFYVEPVGTVLRSWGDVLVWVCVLGNALLPSFLASLIRYEYECAIRDQRRAEQAVRAREHTLAIVSHDLRQPLTAISLQMQLLQKTPAAPQAEQVLRSVGWMQKLIQDLLDAAKAEVQGFKLKVLPRDLVGIIRSSVESFRRLSETRGVELSVEVENAPIPQVPVDEDRMVQVVSNVLDNAIKFTPKGGTVRVLVERGPSGTVDIRVADSGPGIPQENLAHIFERNWQAPDTEHLGTGLGLFIARGIVQAHGGLIWAESEVDRGACIGIRLPVAATTASA